MPHAAPHEKLTLTLKLPAEVVAWLGAEGEPQYRSAKGQAEYLCAQYLMRIVRGAAQGHKNGAPAPAPSRAGDPA